VRTGDIHTAVRNPEAVDEHSFKDWENIVEKYPYFAVGHVFLAKSSHDGGHLDYKHHLQKAALYTANRQALYKLIIGPSLRKKIEKVEEEVLTPVPELEIAGVEVQGDSPVEESLEIAETVHLPEEKESIAIEPAVVKAAEIDELEKEILYEAVYSTIEQEVQEDIKEEQEIAIEEASQTNLADESSLSPYALWLKQRARQLHYHEDESSDAKTKDQKEDLVARFIKSDPKISRRNHELFSTENLGKMSLVDNEDFVTETLAKVYARQGKIEKAIKAYKQLSLKYPEKSIYFANQLKKLENKT